MRLGAGIAATLVLAGCQPLATVPTLPTDAPAQWRNADSADVASHGAAAPDLSGWWHVFGDAELDDLVARALSDNLSVAQAHERLLAARALAKASAAAFKPVVRAGTSSAPSPDATTSYFESEVDAQWELGLFGRAEATNRIASAGVDSASADLQSARVSLVAETVRDFLALRAAQQQEGLLVRIADAQRERRKLMQRRRTLGLASDAELTGAEDELAQAQAALDEPRLRIAASAQQLAVLCGTAEPDRAMLKPGPLPKLDAGTPATVPADLLRTRPDIRRAESEVLAASGELGVARADLYPRLSLGGAITAATQTTGGDFGFTRALPSVGPVIDIPLFDWGARRNRVAAKDAGLSAALDGYRETVLEAVAETETALAAWNVQRTRAQALHASVDVRERDAERAAEARRLGLADGFDQTAAAVALDQARLQLLDAELAQAQAYVSLYKALGGAPLATGAAP